MSIEEQDIFNYAFFPDSLEVSKKKLIEQDKTLTETINFYQKLKVSQNRKSGRDLKEKLANKIPAYSLLNEIYLYPLKGIREPRINKKRLAADSESKNLSPRMMSETFTDEAREYMIKILKYESKTKVYVFSTKNEIVKNFELVVEPSKIRYHFKDNSEPLILDEIIGAENIRIEFSES